MSRQYRQPFALGPVVVRRQLQLGGELVLETQQRARRLTKFRGQFAQGLRRRRIVLIVDDLDLHAIVQQQLQGGARLAAAWVVIDPSLHLYVLRVFPAQPSSTKQGRVSAATYHDARDSQNTFLSGDAPGASSSPPAGTSIHLPFLVSQGSADPQTLQKPVQNARASASSKRRTEFSPRVQANCPAATSRLAACALPEFFRQRRQWQYLKNANGGWIS